MNKVKEFGTGWVLRLGSTFPIYINSSVDQLWFLLITLLFVVYISWNGRFCLNCVIGLLKLKCILHILYLCASLSKRWIRFCLSLSWLLSVRLLLICKIQSGFVLPQIFIVFMIDEWEQVETGSSGKLGCNGALEDLKKAACTTDVFLKSDKSGSILYVAATVAVFYQCIIVGMKFARRDSDFDVSSLCVCICNGCGIPVMQPPSSLISGHLLRSQGLSNVSHYASIH